MFSLHRVCLYSYLRCVARHAMASTFELLADSTRQRLLETLREGEYSVGALVRRLQTSQPFVSKHLPLQDVLSPMED